jgi:hypothetical protein
VENATTNRHTAARVLNAFLGTRCCGYEVVMSIDRLAYGGQDEYLVAKGEYRRPSSLQSQFNSAFEQSHHSITAPSCGDVHVNTLSHSSALQA